MVQRDDGDAAHWSTVHVCREPGNLGGGPFRENT